MEVEKIYQKLQEYNFWNKNLKINLGYKRKFYLNKVLEYLENDLIKVLVGQRRVGKSYILRQIIDILIKKKKIDKKNIFYLNKENINFDEIRDYKDLIEIIDKYKKEIKPKGKIYYFFDEIQEIDGWQKVINSLSQDKIQKSEVFISGSNSKLLSGELSTFLTGRYVDFEIFPFSYDEYLDYFKLQNTKKEFLNFLKSGGLPEFFHLNNEELKRNYLYAVKDSILLKDIVQRYNIKNIRLLENIFDYVSDNIGNIFSVLSIVNFLKNKKYKVNSETIGSYLEYLEQTFLVHKVERYDLKGKKILENKNKFYLNDLSFRNYVFSEFDFGLSGHLENLIYLHFKKNGWKIFVGQIKDAEIDFVIEKGKEKKYIQVVYKLDSKKVIDREFGNLLKIDDAYEKIVLSMDDSFNGEYKGVKYFLAWEYIVKN